MTTTQETYSWQLKLDRSMFDDLQYQSWQDGFREPDEIVVRLINQYLKRYSNKNRIMHDVFHQEIEAIVSYTRVLAFCSFFS
ncbi:MAG: hypothetical protein HOA17_02745 [Candidatus Melainabacteria bacterium]|jgi:succinate dehydrogenase flavin-adding protein (antitoxin of CptAB toxin-antitoxin module)|nr:hypothetical protein [Candidatus Melainabacteria bacterium]